MHSIPPHDLQHAAIAAGLGHVLNMVSLGEVRSAAREWAQATQRGEPRTFLGILVERNLITTERAALLDKLVRDNLNGNPQSAASALSLPAAVELRDTLRDGADEKGNTSQPVHAAAPVEVFEETLPERYRILGVLGTGGLGKVFLAYDAASDRQIALKVIRPDLWDVSQASPTGFTTPMGQLKAAGLTIEQRFLDEAQITAKLEHPNILPVYEIGRCPPPDLRPFYAMRLVRGRTLGETIREAYEMETGVEIDAEEIASRRRRLLTVLLEAMKAVAYAHSRGVVHRDLKPANIMVAEQDEPTIIDWGLAKVRGRADLSAVRLKRTRAAGDHTDPGAVGTPEYMSPEQAAGHVDQIDERSDIYALGAILYELLSGRPPIEGRDAAETLSLVLTRGPVPIERLDPSVPAPLADVCMRALSRDPSKRYRDVHAFAQEIQSFLEGAKERERNHFLAEEQIALAQALIETRSKLRKEIERLEPRVRELAGAIEPHLPEADKIRLWELEDRLRDLHERRRQAFTAAMEHLSTALGFEQHNAKARKLKADLAYRRFRAAEAAGDHAWMREWEIVIQTYDDTRYRKQLVGDGALSIDSKPLDAEVWCYRYVERHRRLVPVPFKLWRKNPNLAYEAPVNHDGTLAIGRDEDRRDCLIGTTPLERVSIPMGSYLLLLRFDGMRDTRVPVLIERGEDHDAGIVSLMPEHHIEGIGGTAGFSVNTRRRVRAHFEANQRSYIFVPRGRFVFGGDREANQPDRQLVTLDEYLIGRFPVTCAEYLGFLNSLYASDPAEAKSRAPRRSEETEAYWPCEDGSGFQLPTREWFERAPTDLRALAAKLGGNQNYHWEPSWPVMGISWFDAMAYCEWRAQIENRAITLPTEEQWERAARGADGRAYPWGDYGDPSRANWNQSRPKGAGPACIGAAPLDESPFGVMDMAGNARDWCLNPPGPTMPEWRVIRGGAWSVTGMMTRAAFRTGAVPTEVRYNIGFRVCVNEPWD